MKLFTKAIEAKLLVNGISSKTDPNFDPKPVCKLFLCQGGGTWLLTELDPDARHIAYGFGGVDENNPELGRLDLNELAQALKSLRRLPVERDLYWHATHRLSAYVAASKAAGHMVDEIPTKGS